MGCLKAIAGLVVFWWVVLAIFVLPVETSPLVWVPIVGGVLWFLVGQEVWEKHRRRFPPDEGA